MKDDTLFKVGRATPCAPSPAREPAPGYAPPTPPFHCASTPRNTSLPPNRPFPALLASVSMLIWQSLTTASRSRQRLNVPAMTDHGESHVGLSSGTDGRQNASVASPHSGTNAASSSSSCGVISAKPSSHSLGPPTFRPPVPSLATIDSPAT